MSIKRKKHTFKERLKYMQLLEKGWSVKRIHKHFGINEELLGVLWVKYQQEGPSALKKKQHIRADGAFKELVLRDQEENGLTNLEVLVKYDISFSALNAWRKIVRQAGYQALYVQKPKGRPRQTTMARPRKKKPEEMTELERLRYENEYLKAENALLKKVKTLVEQRNARLRESGRKPSKN